MNKMSDIFDLPVSASWADLLDKDGDPIAVFESTSDCEVVAETINRHDKLTERVKVLEAALSNLVCCGIEFLDSSDMDDEEDQASIESNFNDSLIASSKALKAGE